MLNNKTYLKTSGTVFGVVGLLHLWRFFMGYELIVGPWNISLWSSLVAGIVLWWLAYNSYKLSSK